jgi:phosphohistidine phosphatase SixA
MDNLGQLIARSYSLQFQAIRLCAVALLVAGTAFFNCNATAQTLAGASLVQHLRQGGYVLLMRHAHSPSEPPQKGVADAANANLERQLDATGRSSARAMGDAIRKLRIPVGAVLSSPTYRALETVRLAALGPAKAFSELGDGGQSMSADAVAGQAGWLRDRVSERPAAGSNTVIVTQLPNIQAAFGQVSANLTDGEALVLHPHEHGNADLVAKIKIEDWPSLARN